jgi:hypothetical protein
LTSFTGDRITVIGEISLLLEIAGVTAEHPCIIVPGELLDHDLLLGADFMMKHEITLKLGAGEVESKFGRARCVREPKSIQHRTKIRMAENTIVPSNTVMFVKARLGEKIRGVHTGLVEPYDNVFTDNGILVTSCITNTTDRMVSVRVMNINTEPVTLHKNKLVGFIGPIKVIEDNRHLEGYTVQRIADLGTNDDSSANTASKDNSANGRPEWTKDWLFKELKLDQMVMTPEDLQRLKNIVWEYKDCFSRGDWDLGECSNFQATIKLKEGATPVWTPSRPVAYKHRGEMSKHLNSLLEAGVIERCTDSCWNNRVFLVPKQNKPGCWRFVADMRCLNTVTTPDKYELPNINHVVDKIGLCKYFSVFDMSQSFHQVSYEPSVRPYTAFSVENKRYWFRRMVMGHRNSSAQFSRLMDRLLSTVPIHELIYFLDDILLASTDVTSHIEKLKLVLQKFKDANLKLTPGKTELLKHEVQFVGITISSSGLRINEDRVKAVLQLKPPSNIKQLQSVLGFFGYNRAFIPNYAAIAKPLYSLLSKHSKFIWSTDCQKSFDLLKRKIADDVILTIPDLDDPLDSFQVTLDASKDDFGATLSQIRDGKRKVCAYYSKSVPKRKKSFGATKLEFLCMYHALQHWRIYLAGTKFVVRTDCASLLHRNNIWSTSDTSMIRKFHKLDQLDFSIEHLSGTKNHICDFLSRYSQKVKYRQVGTQTETISAIDVDLTANKNIERRDLSKTNPDPDITPRLIDVLGDTESNGESDTSPPFSCLDLPSPVENAAALNGSNTEEIFIPIPRKEEVSCVCSETAPAVKTKVASQPELGDPVESKSSTINSVSEHSVVDMETIRKHQKEDEILKTVAGWLQKGERPKSIQAIRTPPDLVRYWRMFNQLITRNDIIYKQWIICRENDKGMLDTECVKQLIIIPDTLKEQTMALTHGTLANLHPGVDESVRRCQMHYYWPGMRDDFKLFIEACTTCGTSKQPVKYLRAPLKHIVVSDFNMCLVIDHIVPERDIATPRRMRYILSITDMFSGYVIAKPTRTQEATESYKIIMHEWVLRFGFPQEIIFDNAPGFKSEFFQLAFKSFGCKMTPGLPYSCASTSKAERANKRINTALRVTLSEEQLRDWDLYLDYVTYGLNSMKSRHTGVSANMIVFGKEVRTPLSLIVQNEEPEMGNFKNRSQAEVAHMKHQLIKTIVRKARIHAQRDFMYADNTYNRYIGGPFFQAGDHCYVLVDCPKHKFSKRWKGPYRITKAIDQHLYVVQLETGEKLCNITKLKRYKHNIYSPDVLTQHTPRQDSDNLSLIPPSSTRDPVDRPKRITRPPDRFNAGQ